MGMFDFIPAVKNHEEASKINITANEIIERYQGALKAGRKDMLRAFEQYGAMKLEVLSTTVYDFVENFEKIKNIEFSEQNIHEDMKNIKIMQADIKEMKQAAVNIKELTAGGITALGSGALAGAAAYGSVGMFAAASTGTAISTLSGAAATNATLAWLGGGALSAGGLGVAGGAVILGSIALAPVLLVGYVVFNSKSKANLAEAKKNQLKAEKFRSEIKLAVSKMDAIIFRVGQMEYTLQKLDEYFKKYVSIVKDVIDKYGTDFSKFPEKEQKEIYLAVMFAQTTKTLLDVNILTSNGDLNHSSQSILTSAEDFLIAYDKK